MVKNIVKKVGAHPLSVDEINFFRDDNTILHFKNPEGKHCITQPTLLSKTTPLSSLDNQKPKLLKIFFPISYNNLVPNNINNSKIWFPIYLKLIKFPIWLSQPLKISKMLNDGLHLQINNI